MKSVIQFLALATMAWSAPFCLAQAAPTCQGAGLTGAAAICSPVRNIASGVTQCLSGAVYEKPVPQAPQSVTTPVPSSYQEQEFFFGGQAVSYASCGIWHSDGVWNTHTKPGANFVSRMLVRMPKDPSKFNGTVVVEWLNTTFGFDVAVDGSYGAEAMAQGFVWVGVSAALKDALPGLATQGYASMDPSRYAAILDAADTTKTSNSWGGNTDYSYDIFTQAAKLLRAKPDVLLGGLVPQRLIAAGQSRSAMRLTTYANAIQNRSRAFDGMLIHSRTPLGYPISNHLIELANTPLIAYIRSDVSARVLQLQTEMDTVPSLGWLARQPDAHNIRTWEVAGASHFDQSMLKAMAAVVAADNVAARDKQAPRCDKPRFNDLPFYRVEKAAWWMLHNWLIHPSAPYQAPDLIQIGSNGRAVTDPISGNALGGIRLPEIEAPLAQYAMKNPHIQVSLTTPSAKLPSFNTTVCNISGSASQLTAAQLAQIYSGPVDYLSKFIAAANRAVLQGVLLREDADKAIATARLNALTFGQSAL